MSDNQKKEYSIGIDIGGTKMLAILFDIDAKEPIADYKLATPNDSLDKFLVMLWALVDPLVERAQKDGATIVRIGVAVPGMPERPTADNPDGRVSHCPNLGILDGVTLGKTIREKYDLPVYMDNDANCFLRAELALGAAQKSANVVCLTFGTGIGAAISINREIFQGVHGAAGEVGHAIVDVIEGEPHTLEEIYHDLTQGNPEQMAHEAFEGDELAIKVYAEIGKFIGIALANIVNVFDPELIVLGGGAMRSSELFMKTVRENLVAEIVAPNLKKIKLVPAKMAEAGGAVGAALLVTNDHKS